MNISESVQSPFNTRTGQLIRRCLRVCRYHDDLIDENYALASNRTVPFVAFAHRPHDARSSCIAILPESRTPHADVAGLRDLGVPLTFLVGPNSWDMWSLRSDGPRHERTLQEKEIEQFFDDKKADFAPGAVFRAKIWARADEGARQLDFVDTGLLPIVEKEAGARLRQLFEDMVAHTMDALGIKPSGLSEADAHWLMKANFWLLAGKLLRDKQVPKFTRLDLNDVQGVFNRVAEHYDAKRVQGNGRLTALRGAAAVAAAFSSFRSVSTETLGALYEEALLSERTRKLLSVHRTPTYLVDYILAKLSCLMENVGIQNCRVFEPACGHSPFLVGAVRLLSDLLPDNIASDRAARRQFLRSHISGCDRDAFALEIARLSLTLADIPNPNGWRLDVVKDMFAGDYLDQNIAKSSVVLVNPPFESAAVTAQDRANGDLRFHRNGQAAELLRRVLRSSQPGTVFGVVVPQTILDGNWFTALRRELLEQCDVREVTVFPDKVFQFADVETGIILARKRPANAKPTSHYLFRRVRETGMAGFIAAYRADQDVLASVQEQQDTKDARLLIPRLAALWGANTNAPRFSSIALIAHGLFFLPKTHASFPRGEVTTSEKQTPGFVKGYATSTGRWETHLSPKTIGFNLNPKVIEWPMEGTVQGQPQVLLNKARVSRAEWRLKAFNDPVGKPFTHRFIVFRPKGRSSLELLWALCNSPYANAYTYTDSGKRDISATFLREMPVPELDKCELAPLENAVRTYLAAAREYSERQGAVPPKLKRRAKEVAVMSAHAKTQLVLGGIGLEEPKALAAVWERLRALHWRVDAEVLKLYALPAELERELLDFFDSVPRVGVPFDQRGYIPSAFREVQRLDEFLRITDEWEQTDERRCQLIEKRIQHGHRTSDEEAEFKELQRLFDLRRSYTRWLRTGDAHSPLFDEEKLRQLQEEDARRKNE